MDKSSIDKTFKIEKSTVTAMVHRSEDSSKCLTWAKTAQFCKVCDQIVEPSYKATVKQNNGNVVCKICRTSFHTCPDGTFCTETRENCPRCKPHVEKAKGYLDNDGHMCKNGKINAFPISECERCRDYSAKKGFDASKINLEKMYEYTLEPRSDQDILKLKI